MCDCYYGFIYARSLDSTTRPIHHKEDIEKWRHKMFHYPYTPEALEVFDFCPKCGKEL